MCYFVGEELIRRYPAFVEEFHEFQDNLEDCIAKATILPPFIARFWTSRVKKERFRIVEIIKPVVEQCIKDCEQGKKASLHIKFLIF